LRDDALGSGIRRRFISYRAIDGARIPAFLFMPARAAQAGAPAVLVIAGHGAGIVETAGIVAGYQHAAALRLAEAGFVTLAPELRGFGHLGSANGTHEHAVAYEALRSGGFLKRTLAQDLQRGTDLLWALDGVDRRSIAVAGASFGGELALTMGMLDERFAAVVALVPGADGWGSTQRVGGRPYEWAGHLCHLVPGAEAYLGEGDAMRLIAPRPLLASEDANDSAVAAALRVALADAYRGAGGSQWRLVETPGRHEFLVNDTVQFLREHIPHQAQVPNRDASSGAGAEVLSCDPGAPPAYTADARGCARHASPHVAAGRGAARSRTVAAALPARASAAGSHCCLEPAVGSITSHCTAAAGGSCDAR
jgi:dienelactone hydrolase